jgi:hypothetical protein
MKELDNKNKLNTCRQCLYSTDNEVGYSKQRKRLSALRNGAASNSRQNIKRMSMMKTLSTPDPVAHNRDRPDIAHTPPMALVRELAASPPLQHFR